MTDKHPRSDQTDAPVRQHLRPSVSSIVSLAIAQKESTECITWGVLTTEGWAPSIKTAAKIW